MSKKILLVGSGAREHVLAETIKRSPQRPELYVFGKSNNPGISDLADGYKIAELDDFDALREFVEETGVKLAFIGPENPLADGIVDFLLTLGVDVASPAKSLARLESSKSFTRDLVAKYGIPGNPIFKVFTSTDGLEEFMRDELEGQFVVKAEGLCGGKGVKVVGDHLENVEEGVEFAAQCISEDGKVVIEEKFIGQEFSLMSFADGETVLDMPAAQDNKRAFNDDKGPNTGGMGSYSDTDHSLPFLEKKDLADAHEITVQVMHALKKECGKPFKGILYGGFIATAKGVRLIEYNARFGDPEAMNVLPLLKTDFVEVLEAICEGRLAEIGLEFENKATVCKYLVPDGYPNNPVKDQIIELKEPLGDGVKAYYASVDKRDDVLYLCGSRAIGMLGVANTLAEAEKLAEKGAQLVSGPVFYREDIGTAELIRKRIDMMKSLRREGSN